MGQGGYLIIAIVILAVLLVTFFVSFVLYVRTPAPKGCEDMKISEENCSSCGHTECEFYKSREEK